MVDFNTELIHGAVVNDNHTGAINPPIYNSSTFAFNDATTPIKWDYARSGNPTREALEALIKTLESGYRGFGFASGLSAIHGVLSIFQPGDHLVVGDTVYGGTFSQLNDYFKRWGLEITAVNTQDLAAVKKAIQSNTKAIYFETFSNPLLRVTDVAAISRIAKAHHILEIVDNTLLTPYLQKPLQLGADIVIHSATKYLGGHSDVIAGLVVVNSESLANRIYFAQNRLGGTLSPETANLVRRGIQTLSVRLDRQIDNTNRVISYLKSNDLVAKINYPSVNQQSDDFEIASRTTKGFGAVLSFEIKAGYDAIKFVNSLKLFKIAVSLGAVESLVELPATMTHFEIPRDERLKIGIKDELIRIAIGLESADDLINDLKQAFAQIQK
ncbi:trans-sulfuration enzyme family protein [Leuconostoc rapi]|uniref:trans-sulfuration enzyme family protein n=1 Tax=Leuconostoc rapi TaxID=1406906 RepID=UPI0019586456|nr:PLP-dependent aspartate aminotransferase family protein [Leuconostoc rapi]MBM7436157.1 cystathionine beta-lyase [Leuconostoc rapi]